MLIDPIMIVKIAFQTCIVIFISLTFTAILFGQPEKLTRGFDPDGIACGADFGSRDYPYIYFTNPTSNTLHQTVCVKSCPKPDHKNSMPIQLECMPNSIVKQCQAKFSIDNPETQFLIYDTFLYKGNICMPRNLVYYETIKEISTPPSRLTNTNDVYQNRWILLIFILIATFASKQLLTQLKANTQYSVWGLTFGLFIFVGTLGVIFVSQARDAIANSLETKSISSFQVDEEYILKMSNVPNPIKLVILSLIFVILTFYGAYFLYNNYDRIKDLSQLFEQVEKYTADHEYLQELSYPIILVLNFFLFLTIYTILSIRACFVIEFQQIGPFEKIQGGILYYFQFLIIFFFFWGVQVIFGINNYIISSSLVQWIQVGHVHKQQQDFQYNHNQSSLILTRYFMQEAFYNIGKIAFASLLLLISPIKFVCDAIKDWAVRRKSENLRNFLTKYCCLPFIQIYKKTRQIEDVVYVEQAINRKVNITVNVCFKFIDDYLELRQEDSNTAEIFEQLRNIVDSFLLIIKIFIALLCAIICKFLLSFKYFSKDMYETNLTSLIAAIIGYYVASLYFQIYSIVLQGLGYIYLRTMNICKKHNEIYEKAQQKRKDTAFETFKTLFKDFSDIMIHFENKIKNQKNNNNEQLPN
ncbi:unnamed protein product [Paramecium pentaurelia]|uniref:Choline transporter-like protein n=1 Tax=Paramecium pentaurelia TaxID=43138 RepID=A0A8S1Y7X8_9CILI|nr:unnamed protein product [Paramecium pentaurelia]